MPRGDLWGRQGGWWGLVSWGLLPCGWGWGEKEAPRLRLSVWKRVEPVSRFAVLLSHRF